jgi:hypothetical protein
MKNLQVYVDLTRYAQALEDAYAHPSHKTWRTTIACWLGKHEWRIFVDEQERVEAIKKLEIPSLNGLSIACPFCKAKYDSNTVSIAESLGLSLLAGVRLAATDDEIINVIKLTAKSGGMIQ